MHGRGLNPLTFNKKRKFLNENTNKKEILQTLA